MYLENWAHNFFFLIAFVKSTIEGLSGTLYDNHKQHGNRNSYISRDVFDLVLVETTLYVKVIGHK